MLTKLEFMNISTSAFIEETNQLACKKVKRKERKTKNKNLEKFEGV